jgi:hypothetical protein
LWRGPGWRRYAATRAGHGKTRSPERGRGPIDVEQ